jgi:NRPS condensation-like uncharacterized protein
MDYTAEIFDQHQWLFDKKGFNDHQIHGMLEFERPLDAEILKKAVIASIDAIPILGARYVEGARPRWTSLDPVHFERAFVVAATKAEFEAFEVAKVDEGVGPQIRVCLLNSDRYAVAFKMNHMICDAAGFKQYLEFLASIYSRLTADANYKPPTIAGDRSLDAAYATFGLAAKLKSLFTQSSDSRWTETHKFPLSGEGAARPFIAAHKLERAKVDALKSYCRAQGATVNDALLTAMYRVLFRILALKGGDALQIPIMVDMRRCLGGGTDFVSLANLTSMVSTELVYRPDESFEVTQAMVRAVTFAKKSSNIGLNGWVKLKLVYDALGDRIAIKLLRSRLRNPLICMTNVGTLDPARMSFAGARPNDAWLCGSIKYKPYFQLAASTYDGEITLTVGQFGDKRDRERIAAFLGDVAEELPGIAINWPRVRTPIGVVTL